MKLSDYKNQITILVAVLLLCSGGLIGTLILSNTNFYIKNLGTSLVQDGKLVNTISVSGDGKVFAKPDMVNLTVSVSELSNTSSDALAKANAKVDQVMTVLKNKGINTDDIKTSQLNISPEYDYTTGGSVLKGQRATVSLDVKVKKLDDKATVATGVIDEVSKVENIQIGSINFDIEDKTALFSKARELAYSKAESKAKELASLSAVKLLKPVSISDTTYDITPTPYLNAAADSLVKGSAPTATQLSSGQLEISINLNVIYGIE